MSRSPPPPAEGTSPATAWQALRRRRALVWLTIAAAVVSSLVAGLLIDPMYESRLQFYVIDAVPGTGGASGAVGGSVLPLAPEAAMTSYVALLQSAALRKLVAAQVGKGVDERLLERQADIGLAKKTTLSVRVLDRDPARAAALANAYPQALERFLSTLEAERRQQAMASLEAEAEAAQQQVRQARDELLRFLSAQATPSVQKQQDLALSQAAQLRTDLAGMQAKLAALDKRIELTATQMRDEVAQSSGAARLQNPPLAKLANQLIDQEVELAAAQAEYDGPLGRRHPKLRMLQARVDELRAQLERESQSLGNTAPPELLREQLRRDLLDQQRQRVALLAELGSRGAELGGMRKSLQQEQSPRLEEQRLTQWLDASRQRADNLSQRLLDMRVQALRRDRSIVVLSPAEPARQARFPSLVWNALLAALLGAVAGCYLALYAGFSGRLRAASSGAADARDGGGA